MASYHPGATATSAAPFTAADSQQWFKPAAADLLYQGYYLDDPGEQQDSMAAAVTTRRKFNSQQGESVLLVMEECDRLMAAAVARGDGDVAPGTLLNILLEASNPFSGERELLLLMKQLLRDDIEVAAQGQFSTTGRWPEGYPAAVLQQYRAEPHRLVHLLARLEYYIPLDRKVVSYSKGKTRGQLTLCTESPSSPASITLMAGTTDMVEHGLRRAQAQVEALYASEPPPIMRPIVQRPTAQELTDTVHGDQVAIGQLRAWMEQHQRWAGVREALGGFYDLIQPPPAGFGPPDPDADPLPRLPDELVEELQECIGPARMASEVARAARDAEQEWVRYDEGMRVCTDHESRLGLAETKLASLANAFRTLQLPAAGGSAGRVHGYMLGTEGLVVTPSIGIYFIARRP